MRDDYFSTDGRRVPRTPGTGVQWFSTLLALCLLLLCVAIGMVGLILPIIPGFLFLMLGALLAARLFPALERRLGRYTWFRNYLDKTRQFEGLTWRGKAQLTAWLVVRLLVDAVLVIVAALAWLLRFAFSRPEAR
jgi:uncharacterized membrane protein YbaN (DUF454 family)